MIVVDRTIERRFENVTEFDLAEWIRESNESSEVINFVGEIPGIATVREAFENSGEIAWLHPSSTKYDPALHVGDPELVDPHTLHNRTEEYEIIECGYLGCSVCYSNVAVLQESMLVEKGKSIYDPEIIAINKKRRDDRKKRKLQHLKLMRLAIQAMQVTQAITDDEEEYEFDEELLSSATYTSFLAFIEK